MSPTPEFGRGHNVSGPLASDLRVDITRLFRMHYVTVFAKTRRID
jgi:hypothetical protein